jgi:hypothetical protein
MKRILEKDGTESRVRAAILHLYLTHDAPRAKDLAPKYLMDRDTSLRLAAALIVFKTGDRAKARSILGDAVATGNGWFAAADALLDDDTPESRKQLKRLFANRDLPHDRDRTRPKVLARCAAAGFEEPYTFYLKMLDINENRLPILNVKGDVIGESRFDSSVAEAFATEIVKEFAPEDEGVKAIVKKFPEAKDQVPYLKKWLRSKLAKKD